MKNQSLKQEIARTSGIILAAGSATRMGRDKLSLPFRGIPMVQHVINAARESQLNDVTVVLPCDSELEKILDLEGCTVVTSPDRKQGQAESFKAGLRHVKDHTQGAMFFLGDQPLITSETIDRLVWAFSQEPECWVAPIQEGMRGNPITIPASWFDRALELKGDTGARPLLAAQGLALRLVRIHEVGPFLDVDTDTEYQQLLKHYDRKSA
ncbi:molybdenum cofactor cytidylyltransferase [Maridesulfovibrio ferrireducens]|uniref:Molybdenum cofactor cytidylyltransferase n=1 Tax=Maridesulfovibrio ferrireducens TaxID=246191 RepID=A0A1G9B908_9BACT|nr:nucleotidyltransferase family protein [Maridesulfovibrio ferrireducens]SDK36042.1 molybdenum cofactor cytidylyltransferase [Maridesulfovibrio ferrireducens]